MTYAGEGESETLAWTCGFRANYRGLFRVVRTLYETSGRPACSLSVHKPNAAGSAGHARQPKHRTKIGTCRPARFSTPSSGGLPQRSGAPRSSGAARRGRVARGTAVSTSVPHAIAATQYSHRV